MEKPGRARIPDYRAWSSIRSVHSCIVCRDSNEDISSLYLFISRGLSYESSGIGDLMENLFSKRFEPLGGIYLKRLKR